jgi:hypothetical protein
MVEEILNDIHYRHDTSRWFQFIYPGHAPRIFHRRAQHAVREQETETSGILTIQAGGPIHKQKRVGVGFIVRNGRDGGCKKAFVLQRLAGLKQKGPNIPFQKFSRRN